MHNLLHVTKPRGRSERCKGCARAVVSSLEYRFFFQKCGQINVILISEYKVSLT